ncbi:MAG: ribosome biogenesis GTPase Der [Chloroflexota bacterium]
MAIPIVAIVGRPNVGKSTLFNRIAGRRIAVVSDTAGTTRDRVSADASWLDHRYIFVDTAGIAGESQAISWAELEPQVAKALEAADAVIFVTDASHPLTGADRDAADLVRRYQKPVVLAANKADNLAREQASVEAYELGLGEPIPISAYHNVGISELMEALLDTAPGETSPEYHSAVRIAIAGRPNVGKSALLNAITGEDRSIVSPVPGTTRDSIDSEYKYTDPSTGREHDLVFVDTAGLRRRGKTEQGIEKYSALRTIQSIERANVALIVLDANEFVTAQDLHVAGYADDAARGIVVVVNKWDLASDLELDEEEARRRILSRFRFLPDSPIVFTSAEKRTGLQDVLKAAVGVFDEWTKEVPDNELRRVVTDALAAHAPPTAGRRRVRIRRMQQNRTGPPTFTFHTSNPELIHFSYRRYLDNRLREAFGFRGSPLRLRFVAAK